MQETSRFGWRSRRRLGIAAVLIGLVAIVGSVAVYAAIPQGNTFTGCYATSGGALRVIDASKDCKSTETKITWNKTGPAGAPGKDGVQGPPGPAGDSEAALVDVATMQITGNDGPILGPNGADIQVVSWQMGGNQAYDQPSGLATGHRQYNPVIIRKRVDKSSPLLFKAVAHGDTIPMIVIQFHHGGVPAAYMTITLENVLISSYQTSSGADNPTESLSFVYQKITWTYTDGGVTMQDDWAVPTGG